MITKTDAIVLKSMKFRDTSKIVTLYTRRFGKIKGVAKGARETKSKFGGTLEPLSLVSLVLYKKENRDLQLISQCDIISHFKRLHTEIERMYIGLSMVELINQLTHEEEGNDQLFLLLRETLEALENAEKNYANLLYAFELRLATIFGYAPSFDKCIQCNRIIEWNASQQTIVFDLGKGGFVCRECAGPETAHPHERTPFRSREAGRGSTFFAADGLVRILTPTAKFLERLLKAKLTSLAALEINSKFRNEIDETLRLYLRYHFEEFKDLRSAQMLERLAH